MKKIIFFLVLVLSSTTMLNAKESIKIDVHAFCSDSKKEEFRIKISSNKLNLSEDAVQDNTGGYVDIPEDSYYLKTNSDVYYLDGVVENSSSEKISQFISTIYKDSKKIISTKELYSLKSSKDLKFIQKINLENNNKTTNTTTNILNVYFDETQFNKEYQKCKEQINQSKENPYTQVILLVFLILGLIYLLKK